jgi:competence protein ComEC
MCPAVSLRAVPSVGFVLILIAVIFSAGCTGLTGISPTRSHETANSGDLRVYFLDVGQGDSSLVLFHDKVILIDAGEVGQGERVVGDLRRLGVDHIDLLVATHPHSDHIGGMQEVLTAFPVNKVLDSGLPHTSTLYEHFLETITKKGIRYEVAEQGQTIYLDPSLSIFVLSPPKERLDGDLNANSIILKISHGTISFLFTGDAGTSAESALMRTGYSPAALVLKVAHHGSSDATSAAFLSLVSPEVAVISLSKDNPYGYPHRETLDALQAAVPAIYRTDRNGTVLIRSDGASYAVKTENGQGGIWGSPFSFSPTTSPVTTPPPIYPSSSPVAQVTMPVLPVVPSNSTLPAIPSTIPIPVPCVSIPAVQIGNTSLVKIAAVQFNAPGDDRENLNGEWVRITNSGEGSVLIAGWTLSDTSGADPYTFPAYLLLSQASVTVYTGSGGMNDTALFMGRTEPVWGNRGDTAFLRDGSGNLVDTRSGGSL